MPYAKDSAIIILRAAEDGYMAYYYLWNVSPPPIPHDLQLAIEQSDPGPTHEDRISSDKTDLKIELSAFIDNFFDV